MNLKVLRELCACVSTPGDEGSVFDYLKNVWTHQKLVVEQLGAYACVAHRPYSGKPKLLLCAHADSPGYTVNEVRGGKKLGVIALGGPHFEGLTEAVLHTVRGDFACILAPVETPTRTTVYDCTLTDKTCATSGVRLGDRVTWPIAWQVKKSVVNSPFLDNRIACAFVAEFFKKPSVLTRDWDVVVAATAQEEVNGFGASVLAEQVRPDAVIALDVTYTNDAQHVTLGGGPVITLSDASITLSPTVRDALQAACKTAGLPLQFEVYNFSGTDARAFPQAGLPAWVLPVLLPTEGNHSAREQVHVEDLKIWRRVVETLVGVMGK